MHSDPTISHFQMFVTGAIVDAAWEEVAPDVGALARRIFGGAEAHAVEELGYDPVLLALAEVLRAERSRSGPEGGVLRAQPDFSPLTKMLLARLGEKPDCDLLARLMSFATYLSNRGSPLAPLYQAMKKAVGTYYLFGDVVPLPAPANQAPKNFEVIPSRAARDSSSIPLFTAGPVSVVRGVNDWTVEFNPDDGPPWLAYKVGEVWYETGPVKPSPIPGMAVLKPHAEPTAFAVRRWS